MYGTTTWLLDYKYFDVSSYILQQIVLVSDSVGFVYTCTVLTFHFSLGWQP